MIRFILILNTILILLFSSQAQAIFNGPHDNTLAYPHDYSGVLWWLDDWPADHPRSGKYWTCGITLVDHPKIKKAYKGKVAITAGHCLLSFFPPDIKAKDAGITERDVFVSFIQDPGMEMNEEYPKRMPTGFENLQINDSPDDPNVFKAHGYTPLPREIGGVGQGPYKLDFAVLILEKKSYIKPALLPDIGKAEELQKKPLSITGYGIAVFGNVNNIKDIGPDFDNSGLALPENGSQEIVGDRQKRTATQEVTSISKYNTQTKMVLSQNSATTTCNGDSGAGLVIEPDVAGGSRTLVSLVSQGDALCKAVGFNTRIDTAEFYQFLVELGILDP